MANDTTYNVFQHYGTNAERLAFTPTPAAGTQPIYIWFETDTYDVWLYWTYWIQIGGDGVNSVVVDEYGALYGDGTVLDPLGVNVDNTSIIINSLNQLEVVGGAATVVVDPYGALDGDGSGGDPLAVRPDNVTITINASNELEVIDGGGSAWQLAGTTAATGSAGTGAWTYVSDVSQVIFTGLAGFTEIMILCRQLTKSVSGVISMTVSIDNGANFLTSSGDYVQVAETGIETNASLINLHGTSATAARSATMLVEAWNLTEPKIYNVTTRTSTSGTSGYIPTANALNALRLFPSAGGNFTGGSIRIYGRT